MIEANIIQAKSRILVGHAMEMSLSDNKTAQLWAMFGPKIKHIKNKVGNDKISLQIYPSDHFKSFDPKRNFIKWATVEIQNQYEVLEGLEVLHLEAGLFAVFDYVGLSSDNSIYHYIYSTWLPSSDYILDDRPHFEVLGDRYDNLHPQSEEQIWIPIKNK